MRVYFPDQRLVLKPRTIHATTHATTFMNEGPHRFFGIRDSPYFKVGIRDLKAYWGRDSGMKECTGWVMPKITLEITGLGKNLGWDDGIKEPYLGPS